MLASRLVVFSSFVAALTFGQQAPFVPVTGPNAPKSVAALFQDSHGALWLGGDDGVSGEALTYFDGSRFVSPVKNFANVIITGFAEDSEGAIWIASSGGVYRLVHGRLDRITNTASAGIAGIAPNMFLVAAASQGRDDYIDLTRITKAHGAWVPETILSSIPEPVPLTPASNFLNMPTVDSQHVLYSCQQAFCEINNADIVAWRTGASLSVKRHPLTVPLSGPVSRDHSGCVWMFSGATSLVQCPGDIAPHPLPLGAGGRGQQHILELPDGSIAIPSMGALAIGQPAKLRLLTRANGYPSVASPLLAKDGSIWLGNADGLFVFLADSRMEFWTEHDGFDGNTWSIVRVGEKMFAAAGNKVFILDDKRDRWQPLVALKFAEHLMAGPGNTLLVSSIDDGVLQIDSQGKILRRSEVANASTLTQTPDGQIWLPGSSSFTKLQFTGQRLDLVSAKIANPQIGGTDMQVDSAGGLWTCSPGGLIHKLVAGSRLLSKNDGLLESSCRAFAFDQSGDIWYAYPTSDFSLIRHPTAAKPVIQHFRGGEAGITGNTFLASDRRGWLWRGTEDGLYVADMEQARRGQWLHLDRKDGLPSTDSNTRSFFQDSDGSIWFGAGATVTHLFPPDDLVHPRFSPSIFISGFSWNGGAFQMANLVDQIEHNASIIAHIGSLQFDRRNALRLRYRLLPEQTSWTSERNLDIALGKLPWGQHTLEVQARLYTGPWSATVSQSFTVLKPLWLQWPAMLGFAFAGAFVAAGGLNRRNKRRRRAQTQLPGLADWRLTVLAPDTGGLEGTVLDDRFEVLRILARGGFATVFKGRDLLRDRACAVKIFRHELSEKSWMARRFQQEVSALQQIDHRNVVGIYGHGSALSGAPYLAMEFISGKTLREVLSEGRLDTARIANYLRQTGSALAEIHAHQICHRDLKPENLMIRDIGLSGADLVLIDFSIAIVQDADETLHGLSRAAGTLQYMAPEQAIGYADASSDIYSLAKILLEMLTGQRLSALLPDASMDLPARIRELLTKNPYGLSAPYIDQIASALEFDPSRRPRNVLQFAPPIADDLIRNASN